MKSKPSLKECKIPLGHSNLFVLVDKEDYEKLSKFHWSLSNSYARRPKYIGNSKNTSIMMHREIMKAPKGIEIDHINHDKLDNRKANLRLVTKQQNAFNRLPRPNASGYKGVYLDHRGMWRVVMFINGKTRYFGAFKDPMVAAKRYNEIAKQYHGEYAYENKI